mmetsp:Transcript_38075/g.100551  ORF Transcript_38075/g.100551 Transcript_38075/m.100551 type:complete len:880 (+) Transcript_38075:60-2699(+)
MASTSPPQDRHFAEFVQLLGGQDVAWYTMLKQMLDETPAVDNLHHALDPLLPLISVAEEGAGMSVEQLTHVVDGTLQSMRIKLITLQLQDRFNEHYAGAINVYTQDHVKWFRFISGLLNDQQGRVSEGRISDSVLACRKFLKLLMAALRALPPQYVTRDRSVVRGVAWVYPEPANPFMEEYFFPGRRIYFFTMRSFSLSEEIAKSFADQRGHQAATMFHMAAGSIGYSISDFSALPQENEVLFMILDEAVVQKVDVDESDGRPLYRVMLRHLIPEKGQPEKTAEIQALGARCQLNVSELAYFFQEGRQRPTTMDKDAIASAELVNQAFDALVAAIERDIQGKAALFLVGATGAGKSTLACWLSGSALSIEYESVPAHQVADSGGGRGARARMRGQVASRGTPSLRIARGSTEEFSVGRDNITSHTFLPQAKTVHAAEKAIVLVDVPGFFDTSGVEVQLAIDLALRHLVNQASSSHIVAMVDITTVASERGASFRRLLEKLDRHFPKVGSKFPFRIAVTRCDETFAGSMQQEWMDTFFGILDQICPGMSDADDAVVFVNQDLYAPSTRTYSPVQFLELPWKGAQNLMHSSQAPLHADCLDPYIERFTKQFVQQGFQMMLNACLKGVGATIEYDENIESSWGDAQRVADEYCVALEGYATRLKEASEALRLDERLIIQEEVPSMNKLLCMKQPRLMLCAIDAEEAFMLGQMKLQLRNFAVIEKVIEELKKENDHRGRLWSHHILRLQEQTSSVKAQLSSQAADIGYENLAQMLGEIDWGTVLKRTTAAAALAAVGPLMIGVGIVAGPGALTAAAVSLVVPGWALGIHSAWSKMTLGFFDSVGVSRTLGRTLGLIEEANQASRKHMDTLVRLRAVNRALLKR